MTAAPATSVRAGIHPLRIATAPTEDGSVIDAIAAAMGVEAQDSAEFARNGSIAGLGRNREVIDAALSMEAGALSEAFATDNGAVIFEVTDRTTFDAEQFGESKDATRDQEIEKRVNQMLAAMIEERKRDLEPKYDAQVVEDFGIGGATTS